MSEHFQEALVELRELLSDIYRESEQPHYGYFLGGDPREFIPDPECSTEEERARHKEECARWERGGEQAKHPAPHCAFMNEGTPPPGFGLGTTSLRDENAVDWAERLGRCIARIERGSE